jgi:DNA-binding transcriptional MocR family regulator
MEAFQHGICGFGRKILIKVLKERNQLVDATLGDYQLFPNQTALFRYLILPQSISDSHIESSCLERGVQIFSSKRFSISTHPSHNAIRLSTSGPKDLEELQRGLVLIREVLTSSAITPII